MEDSACREKEIYNQQSLKRETYNIVFSYTHAYYDQYIHSLTKNIFRYAEGKHVLELGSSSWYRYIYSNNIKPKKITCINISNAELEKGIRLAKSTREITNIEFMIMDANNLAFEDRTFDMVFGGAILHHINYFKAIAEIHRVLKKDGQIMFHEPLGINPMGKLVRILTPDARTKDEKPLGYRELHALDDLFKTEYYYEQLLSVPLGMISRYFCKNPRNLLTKYAYYMDRFIDKNIGILRPFYRYVLIHGKKI